MMKGSIYILFTAGRGPVECTLAVQGIQSRFKKYLDARKIAFAIVSQKRGTVVKSMETIVFEIKSDDLSVVNPWLGTLQWICQSPIRKYHKRKNWFVKCEQVFMSDKIGLDMKDVKVQSFRASGPGGQHRNKVETAIRLIHSPTGIIVTATDAKSQLQNKKKAWAKLAEMVRQREEHIKQEFTTEQWTAQLEIERGSPVKTFNGRNFQE